VKPIAVRRVRLAQPNRAPRDGSKTRAKALAIDGELRNVGIDEDPQDMVAYALSGLIQVR
jgi:hypothetical protein